MLTDRIVFTLILTGLSLVISSGGSNVRKGHAAWEQAKRVPVTFASGSTGLRVPGGAETGAPKYGVSGRDQPVATKVSAGDGRGGVIAVLAFSVSLGAAFPA